MKFNFTKYHGTGNDFILIDDREVDFPDSDHLLINKLCTRRFGIGADGLILIRRKKGFDFEMVYFNADGHRGSMCGNGGRCAVHFAKSLGIAGTEINFLAFDGPHQARVGGEIVHLRMQDTGRLKVLNNNTFFIDTGSPHYIQFVPSTELEDFTGKAKTIRFSEEYKKEGVNVNFVETGNDPGNIKVRTYERGVEDETWSCGTGVVACSIALSAFKPKEEKSYSAIVETSGGKLEVRFEKTEEETFSEIWLIGPAKKVYRGELNSENFK